MITRDAAVRRSVRTFSDVQCIMYREDLTIHNSTNVMENFISYSMYIVCENLF